MSHPRHLLVQISGPAPTFFQLIGPGPATRQPTTVWRHCIILILHAVASPGHWPYLCGLSVSGTAACWCLPCTLWIWYNGSWSVAHPPGLPSHSKQVVTGCILRKENQCLKKGKGGTPRLDLISLRLHAYPACTSSCTQYSKILIYWLESYASFFSLQH